MIFLGFLITENKLKEVTSQTISTLNECSIRTIMATGDNTLTAISVARQCNILGATQKVYFGDVENNQLVWKRAEVLDESTSQNINMNEEHDYTKYVPWELEDDGGKSIGVALNGTTLAFLKDNVNTYEAVLHKVLFKA